MKAAKLLSLYESGQRDFKGINLRGQNFKGKDLSGADFSGADIRSANFTNAVLKGAIFIQAKAGLQKRWAIGLIAASFLLLGIASSVSSLLGALVALILDSNRLENQVLGWISLGFLAVFFIVTLWKGINAVAFAFAGAVAVAVAGAFAFAVVGAGAVAGAFAGAGAVAGAGVFAFAGAVAIAIAVAVAGTFAFAVAVVVALAVAVAVAFTVAGTFAFAFAFAGAGVVAGTVTLLIAYIGWRALTEDKRDAWIRSFAIAFAAIGGTSFRGADLTDANFTGARLKSTDFRRSLLIRTCWREAQKLDRIRSGRTYLSNPKIRQLLLTGNGNGQAFDHLQNLRGINLQGVSLVGADFTGATLNEATLQGAKLADATFIVANLNGVNLQDADLSRAKLVQTQLDQADLTGATLTGACIEDWGISTRTRLEGIRCDYVFMRLPPAGHPDPNPRRKPDDWSKTFAEGEFSDFIAPMVETLDLYHNQAVDPRAVAIAFHELREHNPAAELELVSMEKRGKRRDKFLLRAEASSQADLSQLHGQYFERYEHLLTLPPEAIQALLIEKDRQVRMLARMVDTAIDRPYIGTYHNQGDTVMPEGAKYDQREAQFAGGFAETVQGNQVGGTIINSGDSLDEITRLIAALREQVQTFPAEHKEDALDLLDDLETDLQKPDPNPSRIGRKLKRLAALAPFSEELATAVDPAGDAAPCSGRLKTFIQNIHELAERVGAPIE